MTIFEEFKELKKLVLGVLPAVSEHAIIYSGDNRPIEAVMLDLVLSIDSKVSATSDYRERCLKAIAELERLLPKQVDPKRYLAKIEGIKLALSYFDEMKGETK